MDVAPALVEPITEEERLIPFGPIACDHCETPIREEGGWWVELAPGVLVPWCRGCVAGRAADAPPG